MFATNSQSLWQDILGNSAATGHRLTKTRPLPNTENIASLELTGKGKPHE